MKRTSWVGLMLLGCIISGCHGKSPAPSVPASVHPAATPSSTPTATSWHEWTSKLPWFHSSPSPTPAPGSASPVGSTAAVGSGVPGGSGSASAEPSETDTDDVDLLLEYAVARVNRNQNEDAIRLLTKAHKLDPKNGDVVFWMFIANKNLELSHDRKSESYQWAHEVVKLMPGTTQAEQAQAEITEVENNTPSDAHGTMTAGKVLDTTRRCIWLGFSPNGKVLATISSDQPNGDKATGQIWDLYSGTPWAPDASNLVAMAFAPDSQQVATAGDDVVVWDVNSHEALQHLEIETISMAFVDGNTIAAAIDNTVRLYKLPPPAAPDGSGSPAHTATPVELPMHFIQSPRFSPETNVICLALSDDRKTLATANQDEIKLWDVQTGKLLDTIEVKYTTSLQFSPDGTKLGSAHRDGQLRVWDLKTSKVLRSFDHTGPDFFNDVFGLSPDGLVAGADGDDVRVWDLKTGEYLHEAKAHGATCVSFSHDGKQLATTGGDGQVQMWTVTP